MKSQLSTQSRYIVHDDECHFRTAYSWYDADYIAVSLYRETKDVYYVYSLVTGCVTSYVWNRRTGHVDSFYMPQNY